jgi:transcriptional regulator with XRE-family HTH domain
MLRKNELAKIKANLPRGSQAKIAKKAGVSRSMVTQVLNGKKGPLIIIEEALKMAEAEKERKVKLQKRIKNLAPAAL